MARCDDPPKSGRVIYPSSLLDWSERILPALPAAATDDFDGDRFLPLRWVSVSLASEYHLDEFPRGDKYYIDPSER